MPADPTANLGSKRMETKPEDIGHVAPDFSDRKHFNSLVVRPQYRISLRLGPIEELFPNAPNTPAGRMERMQVLGLFYYPLKHARATRAFNGRPPQPAVAAAGGNPAQPALPAIPGLWTYFKTRVMNGASDADADQEIQRLLKEWIVDGGNLPPAAEEGAAPAAANFAKLRLPGTFTLMQSWRSTGINDNDDPSAPYAGWTLGKNLYDVETQYYTDNPILRKIPLIALVEKFDTASAEWKPAVDAQVYFKLVDTYALPAFDPAQPVNAQLNRPPLRASSLGPPAAAAGAGPGQFAQGEENPTGARQPDPSDPQRGNCPQDRGGEQGKGNLGDGTDVAGVIFSTTSLPGFNAAHTPPVGGTVNPITRTNFFPLAERVNDPKHLHAIKAKTNADGEAGVIFMPSRSGGDRYRFRVYLGPPTMAGAGGDGTGTAAVKVETGTFVTWRSMRISRYVQQPARNVDATLLADAAANAPAQVLPIGGVNVNMPAINPANASAANDYLRRAFVVDNSGTYRGLSTGDFSMTVPAAGQFDSLPVQWARAFVEVEIDRAAQGNLPETMTNGDWTNARIQALRDGVVGMGRLGLNLDLERLLLMGASQPASLNVTNAVVHLPMRSIQDYNTGAGAPPAARRIGPLNTAARVQQLIAEYVVSGFVRWFSFNGYTPGVTAIQGAYGNSWILFFNYSNSSGESYDYRGGTIWAGAAAYPNVPTVPSPGGLPWANYGFTSNTCHEIGHICFCLHANPPAAGNAVFHDPTANNRSVCVMSYQNCEGQFCAKCLFALRGWNIATLTY